MNNTLKNLSLSLLTFTNICFCMEMQPLLQDYCAEINIAMPKKFPSLKKLTSQEIIKNYDDYKKSIDKLDKDTKEKIDLKRPLTAENVLLVYDKKEKRKDECLNFLLKEFNLTKNLSTKEILNFKPQDYPNYTELIQKKLKENNYELPQEKIKSIALFLNQNYIDNKVVKKNDYQHLATIGCIGATGFLSFLSILAMHNTLFN